MRTISSEAPALGSLPATAVGLGAAPMRLAQRGRRCKRGLMAAGYSVCTWLGKSSPCIIRRCLFIDKVSYLVRNKVKDSTLSPKPCLNHVLVKIRSGFSVSFVLEPRRRKAPVLGCCWAGHGPHRLGKGKKQVVCWDVCGEREHPGVVLDTLEKREKKSGGAKPASGPHRRKRKPGAVR
jgi:hypothetical protein